MKTQVLKSIVVLSLWSILGFLGGCTSITPSYKFTVGQKIEYAGTGGQTDLKTHTFNYGWNSEWTLWVTGQESANTWRGVVSNKFWMGLPEEHAKNELQQITIPVLIHANGQIEGDELTLLKWPSPLPILPGNHKQMVEGYTAQPNVERVETYKPLKKEGGMWQLRYGVQVPEFMLKDVTSKVVATYDPQLGLTNLLVTRNQYKNEPNLEDASLFKLNSVEQKEAQWTKELDHEAALFASATKAFDQAYNLAQESDPASVSAIIAPAATAYNEAFKEIKSPEFQAVRNTSAENLDQLIQSLQAIATYRATLLNKPAPDWELEVIDPSSDAKDQPTKVSLKQLRGKVVVIDFWDRTCIWSIHAIPLLKQLTADFKGRNVAVYGINIDPDVNDAKFVMEKLKVNYPSVHYVGSGSEESLLSKYVVMGIPHQVIIDQEGIVRAIHSGYDTDMVSTLSKTIESLLRKK